jgi:hypothetical protein
LSRASQGSGGLGSGFEKRLAIQPGERHIRAVVGIGRSKRTFEADFCVNG